MFILTIFIILCLPITIYADSISLICPSKINNGVEFSCQINGNSSNNITSLSAKVIIPSGLSFISFKKADNWQGDGDNGFITLYTEDPVTGRFNIGMLKLKHIAGNSNTVNLNSSFFYEENGKEFKIADITKKIELKAIVNPTENNTNNNTTVNNNSTTNNNASNSNDNSITKLNDNNNNQNNNNVNNNNNSTIVSKKLLKNIIIDNYNINFDEDIYNYELQIKDESYLTITPEVIDNTTYNIIGNDNLIDGSIIEINVTDEQSVTKTYTITVKKEKKEKSSLGVGSIVLIIIIVILSGFNIYRIIKNKGNKN